MSPSSQSDAVEAIVCRWAEWKYELPAQSVVKVEFEFEDDGDYSEVTPGDGPYLSVTITFTGSKSPTGQRYTQRQTTYDTALIREILAFGVQGGPPDA